LIHALSPIVPLPREISEMAYLWQVPHQIAGDRLKPRSARWPHRPLDVAWRGRCGKLG